MTKRLEDYTMREYAEYEFDMMCKNHDEYILLEVLDSIPIEEIERYLRKKKLISVGEV